MSDKPNIIIILCDQLRRRALSLYGDPNITTPNIDRLGKEGVYFSTACSTFPVCVPFRFTMLTGEYAHSRNVPAIEWRMSPSERTFAHEFNDAGYHTAYVGKWHLFGGHGVIPGQDCAKANKTRIPKKFRGGFEKWIGFELANKPFETYYFEDDDPEPKLIDGYQTDGLFDMAMEHLSGIDDPFCSVISVEPPHFPLQAPKELEEKWAKKEIKFPPNFLFEDTYPSPDENKSRDDIDELTWNQQIYYAMIENLDNNVGRLMSWLEEQGKAESTIVVFTSDHGQMDGSHSKRSTIKEHPYEESIGIPLIVHDPRLKERSASCITDPVCAEDLCPTFLGLAGLSPRDEKPGIDLTPIIKGETDSLDRDAILLEFCHDLRPPTYWGTYYEKFWRGIRTQQYKYTLFGDSVEGGKPWQLFDMEEDPYEMNNLLDDPDQKDLQVRLHKRLRKMLVDTDDHYVLAPAFGEPGLNLWKTD